jgi:hypothetical protein
VIYAVCWPSRHSGTIITRLYRRRDAADRLTDRLAAEYGISPTIFVGTITEWKETPC